MGRIRPLGDRVLVKRDESEETTAGGIVIPGNAQQKEAQGLVRAVGPGKRVKGAREELDVRVGDKVLFGKYTGTDVEIGGEKLLLMREEDILAVIDG